MKRNTAMQRSLASSKRIRILGSDRPPSDRVGSARVAQQTLGRKGIDEYRRKGEQELRERMRGVC